MVFILEIPFAAIAAVVCVVSWKTLRTIKHLSVGKSFWIPILLSGIFFFVASILAIFNELILPMTTYIVEDAVSVARLLALCCLTTGVYVYSRKITKNLVEKLTLPAKTFEVASNEETEPSESIIDRLDEKPVEKEIDCKHQLGYLRTLKRGAHIPEECLGCHRIIECKYSNAKKTKSQQSFTIPTNSNISILSETVLEEENAKQE